MTDKEKIHQILSSLWKNDDSVGKMCYNQALQDVQTAIDLQEEPVSEGLEEAAKNHAVERFRTTRNEFLAEKCKWSFKAGAKWQKTKDESCSKDLGEYINELSKQFPEVSFAKLSRIAVRVAKWQEKQDQSTIELAEDHAMLAGMEKMREQMMAKAVDGDITFDYYGDDDKTYGCIAHDSFCLEDFGLKDRDKVKVIVIKDD